MTSRSYQQLLLPDLLLLLCVLDGNKLRHITFTHFGTYFQLKSSHFNIAVLLIVNESVCEVNLFKNS